MGQPSVQASNAIIYLTYGAFLSVHCFLFSSPLILSFSCLLCLSMFQCRWPLHCLAMETSVEVRLPC